MIFSKSATIQNKAGRLSRKPACGINVCIIKRSVIDATHC